MNIIVDIPPDQRTDEGFAPVNLVIYEGERLCQLDIQYSKLASIQHPNAFAIDFLILAATVYALDKLVLRKTAIDNWTREFSLTIPVSNIEAWSRVKQDLDSCLSFLTGDLWDINFVIQATNPIRPINRQRRRRIIIPTGDTVSLFSGGLDSLIGVIDWLESHPTKKLIVVGHHDAKMPGPYSDQKSLLDMLRTKYRGQIEDILVRIGHSNEIVEETEITLRGRSIIFIALGIFVASSLGPTIPLLIPENGTIALNVPLTPSRRGSCSTRTAHPHYLKTLANVLTGLGLTNPILNPLALKTKGEAVTQCLEQQLLQEVVQLSVSCAKRGHKINFTHREAKSCGRCMPCIYRRAALHTIGWDNELYGDDVCSGEVDIEDEGDKQNDLRACLSFLNLNASQDEISARLLANGSLDAQQLTIYANLVQRTMNEIRTLFIDKAIPEIKRQAGIK